MESNPEPFKPHYCQLLQLLSAVLQDHDNPKTLYYCILTLTAITAYIGSAELVRRRPEPNQNPFGRRIWWVGFFFNASSSLFPQQNQMRALIPSLIGALRHLIKADEVGAP